MPLKEAQADQYYGVWVRRNFGGRPVQGRVEEIDIGIRSKERLYFVKYDDGGVEHLSEEEVKEYRS